MYVGTGAGKTTAAFGLALRALGHDKKVVIIQFIKGRKDIGEYKIQKKLKNFKIYQFGRKEFVNPKKFEQIDYQFAREGLEFIGKMIKEKPFLLILDEINLAASKSGLINPKEVIKILKKIKKISKNTHIVLTGRYAPKEFYKIADFINEVKFVKMPKKLRTIRGIQY